jgi:hypothetical protein
MEVLCSLFKKSSNHCNNTTRSYFDHSRQRVDRSDCKTPQVERKGKVERNKEKVG